ncbi:protein chibby-like protein 1 [Zopfochytrium polystomum]|nr:protein chibby-like protein 1 [Zopfochytrium polystomum]
MERHLRRFSDSFKKSPVKQNPQRYDPEDESDPIRMVLGDVELVYENREWQAAGGAESKELAEKNRLLEVENQLLKFKLNMMMDMLSTAKLDLLTLQNEKNMA